MTQASVIINNHNYGRFLRAAIDSALAQAHRKTEVIVVDDGSSDDSRQIIREYGSRVLAVLQENGGQASAVNAGFERCRGDFVLFLDSDDILRPTAVESAAPLFSDPSVAKVQWRQQVADESGRATGRLAPKKAPPDGDLWEEVVRYGPDQFAWPALSGNAWSRRYLDSVFPAPELYRRGVDNYLFQLAPYFGRIESLAEPQTLYRTHDQQISQTITFEAKLQRQIAYYRDYSQRAADRCRSKGEQVDLKAWEAHSWWCRLERATNELDRVLPEGAPFALIDDDLWGLRRFRARRVQPFTERDGVYWGPPRDDDAALERLEQIRDSGMRFLAIAWPAYWWLECYEGLHRHLRSRFSCLLETSRVLVFEWTR